MLKSIAKNVAVFAIKKASKLLKESTSDQETYMSKSLDGIVDTIENIHGSLDIVIEALEALARLLKGWDDNDKGWDDRIASYLLTACYWLKKIA